MSPVVTGIAQTEIVIFWSEIATIMTGIDRTEAVFQICTDPHKDMPTGSGSA